MSLVSKFKRPVEKGELQVRQLVNSLTKKLDFTENCVVLCYWYIYYCAITKSVTTKYH